jgi:hypothetical protein
VEVKTARHFRNKRCELFVCTRDGNQSWNGLPKKLDPGSCDYLFVLVADGRRWFIPSSHFGRDHVIVWAARSTTSSGSSPAIRRHAFAQSF